MFEKLSDNMYGWVNTLNRVDFNRIIKKSYYNYSGGGLLRGFDDQMSNERYLAINISQGGNNPTSLKNFLVTSILKEMPQELLIIDGKVQSYKKINVNEQLLIALTHCAKLQLEEL